MKTCCNCQKELSRKSSESPSHYAARKFCDRSCAASFNNRIFHKRKKEEGGSRKNEKPPFKTQVCECCKEEFQVRLALSQDRYIKRQFCDVCVRVKRLDARNFNNKSIESRTKQDLFSTRKNWQSARTCIRVHAEKIMNLGGKEKICSVCNYSAHVEICHIKSVSDFSGDSILAEINDPLNLVYLCPNHHWEFDKGLLDLNNASKI